MKVSTFIGIVAMSILSQLFGTVSAADDIGFDMGKASYRTTDSFGGSDVQASNGKATTTDAITSQDKKITCTVPHQKKKPVPQAAPKPELAVKSGVPTLSNVCAPVININLPLGTSELYAQSTRKASDATSVTDSQTSVVTPTQPTLPPDSFKFKIKDLVEADVSTHNGTIMGIVIAIFVGFSLLVALSFRITASRTLKSGVPWVMVTVTVMLASLLAYWVVGSFWPKGIKDTTIERLYTDLVTAQNTPTTETTPNWSVLGQQLVAAQTEIKKMQNQLSEQLNVISDNNISDGWRQNTTAIFLFSSVAFYLFIIWCHYNSTPTPFTNKLRKSALLEDLYHLENELSKVSTAIGNKFSDLERPDIKMNDLLQAIDRVRKLLEYGRTPIDSSETLTATYIFQADSGESYYLSLSLRQLESFLSSRYELRPYAWRKVALKQLSTARGRILSYCSVHPSSLDSSIN